MYIKTLMLSLRQFGHAPVLIGIDGSRLFKELQAEGVECIAWKKLKNGKFDERKEYGEQEAVVCSEVSPIQGCLRKMKSVVLKYLPGGMKLLAGNVREMFYLRKIFKSAQLDILQVNIHGYEVAGMAAKLANVKVIGFFHTSPVFETNIMRRWLMNQTGCRYDKLCFPSRFTANAWIQMLNVAPSKCTIVPCGIDVSRFASIVSPARNVGDSFRLVSVGRLHPMKGYSHLIDSVAKLDDARIVVNILGEGDEWGFLDRKIKTLGLGERVHLRGHIEQPEALIKAAHAFILLSNSHESFGIALVEAMAAGLPLITSDYGPFPEINKHGVTGVVVPADDVIETAKAIKALADNPALCRDMGERGRERGAVLYDRKRMTYTMQQLYAHLV